MGEFDQPGDSAAQLSEQSAASYPAPVHPASASSPSSDALLPPATVPELPAWRARARRPLTTERILEEVGEGTVESGRVMEIGRAVV